MDTDSGMDYQIDRDYESDLMPPGTAVLDRVPPPPHQTVG